MCFSCYKKIGPSQPNCPWRFHHELNLTLPKKTGFAFWGPPDTLFFCHVWWKIILEFLTIKLYPGWHKFYDRYSSKLPSDGHCHWVTRGPGLGNWLIWRFWAIHLIDDGLLGSESIFRGDGSHGGFPHPQSSSLACQEGTALAPWTRPVRHMSPQWVTKGQWHHFIVSPSLIPWGDSQRTPFIPIIAP